MGTTMLICVLVLIIAFLFWRLLGANVLGKNRAWSAFEHFVRSLLVLMENGGYLTVKQRRSDLAFRFKRVSGVGESALMRLEIPRAAWIEVALPAVKEALADEPVKFCDRGVESAAQPFVSIDIPVDDIWSERAGAEGARVAHIILRAASVSPDARFDFDFTGARSNRMSRHYGGLRAERRARKRSS